MRHAPWLFCLGLLIVSTGTGNAQALIEGVVETIDHRADASAFRVLRSSRVVWASPTIYRQDANFLRLHFTDVRDDRATSFTVRIVSGDQTLFTRTPEEMGRTTDFWTPKLMSSRVQVVVETDTGRKPAGLSFRISALAYPRVESQILSYFGREPNYSHLREHTDDRRLMDAARAVARLDFIAGGQSKACTGFLISNNRLLTNDHCISSQEVCRSTWVVFDHRLTGDGSEEQGPAYRCKQLLSDPDAALAEHDGAVFEVYGDPGADGRAPLAFAVRAADQSHSLVMIHHPGAEPMRVSTKRCQVKTMQAPGKHCQDKTVAAPQAVVAPAEDCHPVDFGHRCDSKPGSSGAPILDSETLRVVGLHHWGFQTWGPFMRENRAVRVEHIRPLMP